MIQSGKTYQHFKGGLYTVLFVVEESTNARKGGKGVVYVSHTYGTIKYRDLDEFIEEVVWPDGNTRSRFVLFEG